MAEPGGPVRAGHAVRSLVHPRARSSAPVLLATSRAHVAHGVAHGADLAPTGANLR